MKQLITLSLIMFSAFAHSTTQEDLGHELHDYDKEAVIKALDIALKDPSNLLTCQEKVNNRQVKSSELVVKKFMDSHVVNVRLYVNEYEQPVITITALQKLDRKINVFIQVTTDETYKKVQSLIVHRYKIELGEEVNVGTILKPIYQRTEKKVFIENLSCN